MRVGRRRSAAGGRPGVSLPIVELDGRTLTPEQVVEVARGRAEARMADDARARNAAAERLVRSLVDRGELLYGVTTGVGVLRSRPSALENRDDYQWRLIRRPPGGGGGARAGGGRGGGGGGGGGQERGGGG